MPLPVTSSSRSVMAVDMHLILGTHVFGPHQAAQLDQLSLLRKSQLARGLHHQHAIGQHVDHFGAEGGGQAGVGGALALRR